MEKNHFGIKFDCFERILHLPQGVRQGIPYSFDRRTTHKRSPSWNLEYCRGNLAPFWKKWCTFLKRTIPDNYQLLLQWMSCMIAINTMVYSIYKWILVWHGVGIFRRRLSSMKLYTDWRSFPDHRCTFSIVAIFQREGTKSGHTFFKEYHLLWTLRLGITGIRGLYAKKMSNPCPKCTLFALFCMFLKHAKFLTKLDEHFGTRRLELARVMMWEVMNWINQDQSRLIRIIQNLEKPPQKNQQKKQTRKQKKQIWQPVQGSESLWKHLFCLY